MARASTRQNRQLPRAANIVGGGGKFEPFLITAYFASDMRGAKKIEVYLGHQMPFTGLAGFVSSTSFLSQRSFRAGTIR